MRVPLVFCCPICIDLHVLKISLSLLPLHDVMLIKLLDLVRHIRRFSSSLNFDVAVRLLVSTNTWRRVAKCSASFVEIAVLLTLLVRNDSVYRYMIVVVVFKLIVQV